MQTYICYKCNYKTKNKNHFTRHNVSKKHIEHVKSEYTCDLCDKVLADKWSKSRHVLVCSKKIVEQKNALLKSKDNIIESKDVIIKTMKKTNTKAMTAFDILTKYLPNAPAITMIDTTPLKYNRQTENKDYVFYANKLRDGQLHIYVGDYIIQRYVTPNPYDQSIWKLNANRNNFAVKVSYNQHPSTWKHNGNGNDDKFMTHMVNPVITTLQETMKSTIDSLMKQSYGDVPKTFIGDFGTCYNELQNISKYIGHSKFVDDIISYIKNKFLFTDDIINQIGANN